jgi:hypothetical protein
LALLRASALIVIALACACQPEPAPPVHDAAQIAPVETATPRAVPEPIPSVATLRAPDASTSEPGPLTDDELAFFEELISDEILFPRPAERARYERLESETIKNQCHVSFEKHEAHFAQHLLRVRLSQTRLAAQRLDNAGHPLSQVIEHGGIREKGSG